MFFAEVISFAKNGSANYKKNIYSAKNKSTSCHIFQKVRKSNKFDNSANLRIYYLRNLFSDRPTLTVVILNFLCVFQF
jgi:hypothetical protein